MLTPEDAMAVSKALQAVDGLPKPAAVTRTLTVSYEIDDGDRVVACHRKVPVDSSSATLAQTVRDITKTAEDHWQWNR